MKTLEEIWEIGLQFKIQQKKSEFLPFLELLLKEGVKDIIEIGICFGGSSACFCNIADRVIGIDVPVTVVHVPENELKQQGNFHFIVGDTHKSETVDKVKQILGDKKVDLLFIDGDHEEIGVRKDFEMFTPFVKENGLVAFHDIADSPYHRAARVSLIDFYNELIPKYKHIEFLEEGGIDCGIGVIYL